jgi:iron complex transport system permease protein
LAGIGLVAALVLLILLSPLIGPVPIPASVVFAIMARELTGGLVPGPACGAATISAHQCFIWTEIVWLARVPPLILAVGTGAALGISGAALQGIFRNPLADPYLLGLSSGGAMGAALILFFGIGLATAYLTLPLFAFLGGLAPGLVVYLAASRRGRPMESLVLTGVALASFFSAILATLLVVNPSGGLQVTFWLLGSMSGGTWPRDGIVLGGVLALGGGIGLSGRELNLLQLGPDVAQSLGVDARRTAQRLVLLTTLMTAIAVAFAGVIGFVGLVSPHVVRRLLGPDYRLVLPFSALVGAVFLVVAWDLAQVVVPSIVLPVGIPTSFVGAPFFIYLLYRRRPGPLAAGVR